MKVYGFRVMLVFVMYYIYVTSGSSLLIESTDSMITRALRAAKFSHITHRPRPFLAKIACLNIGNGFANRLVFTQNRGAIGRNFLCCSQKWGFARTEPNEPPWTRHWRCIFSSHYILYVCGTLCKINNIIIMKSVNYNWGWPGHSVLVIHYIQCNLMPHIVRPFLIRADK